MKNNFEWVQADKGEWGSEFYWLLPEYSSTTKEVKSGATSYPACLTYIPIVSYTYTLLVLSHNGVPGESYL